MLAYLQRVGSSYSLVPSSLECLVIKEDNKTAGSCLNTISKKTIRKDHVEKKKTIEYNENRLDSDRNIEILSDQIDQGSQDDNSDCDSFGALGDWGNYGSHDSKATDSEESDDESLKLQVSFG